MENPTRNKSQVQELVRRFEKNESITSLYVDISIIADLNNEFVLQFFQTELGVPNEKGDIVEAKAVLKSKLVISPDHAARLHESLGVALRNKVTVK